MRALQIILVSSGADTPRGVMNVPALTLIKCVKLVFIQLIQLMFCNTHNSTVIVTFQQMMKTFDAENVPFCREGSAPDFGTKFGN